MLFEPVVSFEPAPEPIAMFELPVVLPSSAVWPTAVLSSPLVFA